LILLLSAGVSRGDDIDIYRDGAGVGQPWVHVLLDLRGALTGSPLCTFGVDCQPPFLSSRAHSFLAQSHSMGDPVSASAILLALVSAVLDDPRFDAVRVALIMPNHPGNTPAGSLLPAGGGTILAGYRPLETSRAVLLDRLQSIPLDSVPADQASQPREALFEWYRYITGGNVALGINTLGNFGQLEPDPDYDPDIINGDRYVSPFVARNACPRVYGIIGLLGLPGDDTALDAEINRSLSIPADSALEHFLAVLHHPETDLLPGLGAAVRVRQTLVLATKAQAALATALASAGGGTAAYFLEQPFKAESALRDFLGRVVGGDASFLSASVSPDVLEPGRLLERYYVPLFQASGGANWRGNVKKFRFAAAGTEDVTGETVVLLDARGAPALVSDGPEKGRIVFDALSFWTDSASLPPGDGTTVPVGADGRLVDRGGAGQKIDGFIDDGSGTLPMIGDVNAVGDFATRQVFVEPPEPGPFIPFNADAPTLELLRRELDPGSVFDDSELLDLVRWGRGQAADGGNDRARSWLMGGVIHSRPLAINYGAISGYSGDNPGVRLFFGSTDGLFHILEDTNPEGKESGRERFAFYPRQLLADLAGLRSGTRGPATGYYGVDGAPVGLRVDRDGDGTIEPDAGDEVYVYFGLRRGGRGYYALDVSDPGLPPRLKWRIRPREDFKELALGFSTPLVAKVQFESVPRDVLIFGAGYHGGWSNDGTSRIGKDLGFADDPVGNAIYIVDARSGELIWKAVRGATGSASERHFEHAGLTDSVPSAVAALRNAQDIVYRLYVGDTGGTVWRVDLPPGEAPLHRRDNWTISVLADLGRDPDEADGSEARDLRFFHRPEIVRSFDTIGDFEGVIIQSGDRAHPLAVGTQDHLFYIKDRSQHQSGVSHYRFEDLVDRTVCVNGAEIDSTGIGCSEHQLAAGWKLRFSRPGEKGLSRPLVDGGRVFATTYSPPSTENSCSALEGQGHLYALKLQDATALAGGVRVHDLGQGIPPEPVHLGGLILLPGTGVDPGVFTPGSGAGSGMGKLIPTTAPQRYRVYWREPAVDPF
jgi:type IV pilus assembly protein PilY1